MSLFQRKKVVASTLACAGVAALLGGAYATSVLAQVGSTPTSNVATFRLDLITGSGAGPAANWYSVRGGSQILHKTDKTTGEDQFQLADSGDIEFSEIEVVGPFVSGGTRSELIQLLNAWSRGKGKRFNATLDLLDSNQQAVRGISLTEIIPVEYHPPSVRDGDDSLLEERFSFKPERVEDTSASNGGGANQNGSDEDTAANSAVRGNAEELEQVITGRNFRFEIDGREIPVTEVDPGSLRLELKDATMGNRQSNFKDFTVTKPQFGGSDEALNNRSEATCGNWVIARPYNTHDKTLEKLFAAFAEGDRETRSGDSGSLIYLDRDGKEARRIDFVGFAPVRYESINLDSRNAREAATETMEFSVARCQYS